MRAAIREMGRMRMAERDRDATLAALVELVEQMSDEHRRVRAALERTGKVLASLSQDHQAQIARLRSMLTRQRRAHEVALGAVIRRHRAELDQMAADCEEAERRARAEGRTEGFAEGYAHGVSRRQQGQPGES